MKRGQERDGDEKSTLKSPTRRRLEWEREDKIEERVNKSDGDDEGRIKVTDEKGLPSKEREQRRNSTE